MWEFISATLKFKQNEDDLRKLAVVDQTVNLLYTRIGVFDYMYIAFHS